MFAWHEAEHSSITISICWYSVLGRLCADTLYYHIGTVVLHYLYFVLSWLFSLNNTGVSWAVLQHSCSNLFLTNTSVAAVLTSNFQVSAFRFHSVFQGLRLFHYTKHPQYITHPVYHLQLQRKSGTYSWSVSSVVSRQMNRHLVFFSYSFCKNCG
jgi:hypothetical protein